MKTGSGIFGNMTCGPKSHQQDDIWETIAHYLISGTGELPLFPFIAVRLMEIIQDPESTIMDLHRVIASDQVMASRVLRVANSLLDVQENRIASINRSIIRLGYEKVFNIAFAGIVSADMNEACYPAGEIKKLWEHSVGCAMICRVIAATEDEDPDEAFTAGLIHDMGKLVLFREKNKLCKKTGISEEEYDKCMGKYHARICADLTETWNFPLDVSDAVRYHHEAEYGGDAKRLTAITSLGNMICHIHGTGCNRQNVNLEGSNPARILKMKPFKLNALNEAASTAFNITSELFPVHE